MTPRDHALPAGTRVCLDRSVRRSAGGILIGGAPIRVVRLTAAGARLVDRWAGGEPVGASPQANALARRLIDGGLAHPRPATRPGGPESVTVVIPVRDRPDGVAATLAALAHRPMTGATPTTPTDPTDPPGAAARTDPTHDGTPTPTDPTDPTTPTTPTTPTIHAGPTTSAGTRGRLVAPAIIVDDGSTDPDALLAAVAPWDTAECPATVIRRPLNGGPAAARNLGWRAATTEMVAFLDADCEPQPGWLTSVLPLLEDPTVAAVAPRVVPRPASGSPPWLVGYERAHSSLDMGPRPAPVRPRSWVPYVPTAALVVRRAVLVAVGGFDEALRSGEDVDLVWRLHGAGWRVRYAPETVVAHPVRAAAGPWLRQRVDYGRSAAPLARRHGEAVAPLNVSPWSAAAWALAVAAQPLAGALVAGGSATALWRHVGEGAGDASRPVTSRPARPVTSRPVASRELVRLALVGHCRSGQAIASALVRAWWPAALVAAAISARARRAVVLAAVVPALADWARHGRRTSALRWVALRLVDDAAYGWGVWAGCRTERSWAALVPRWASGRPPAR